MAERRMPLTASPEDEAKFFLSSEGISEVRRRLEVLGAPIVFDGVMDTRLHKPADGFDLRNTGCALLRDGTSAVLTIARSRYGTDTPLSLRLLPMEVGEDAFKKAEAMLLLSGAMVKRGTKGLVGFTHDPDFHLNGDTYRIRDRGDQVEWTIKRSVGNTGQIKRAAEYQLRVESRENSFEDARRMVELLGFFEYLAILKQRTSYAVDMSGMSGHVEIDHILSGDHQPFVEIEAANINMIRKIARCLGLSMRDASAVSTKALVLGANNLSVATGTLSASGGTELQGSL